MLAELIHDMSFYQETEMKNETQTRFPSIVAIHLTNWYMK